MEKNCGYWFPQQHPSWQSPNLNTSSAPLEVEQQNTISAYMNPGNNMIPTNGTLPVHAFSELPHSQPSQTNEPHGWFYCLPRFRQTFTHAPNSILEEKKLPASPYENRREVTAPNLMSAPAQKRFLVFDQSGDQTTLVFSSVIGTPGQCLTSRSPKLSGAHNSSGEEQVTKRDHIYPPGPTLTDESNENGGTESEMHEDTEELNALLYSDDEDSSSDDDEETSTGHSPSTMTAYDQQNWLDGNAEEVASSDGSNKRRKLYNGNFNVPSLMDTATSAKLDQSFEYEDDAESSCANGNYPELEEIGLSGNKRLRKDRIRETVNILQSLIPGGKGKDAIMVLDEAIHYLKALKFKAKALGLDTL